MSVDLITAEQAAEYLRSDPAETLLAGLVSAASAAVVTYLKNPAFLIPEVEGGEIVVPADVQLATLMLVAEFYTNRGAEQAGEVNAQFGYGYLPRPVLALLYPYRTPTLA